LNPTCFPVGQDHVLVHLPVLASGATVSPDSEKPDRVGVAEAKVPAEKADSARHLKPGHVSRELVNNRGQFYPKSLAETLIGIHPNDPVRTRADVWQRPVQLCSLVDKWMVQDSDNHRSCTREVGNVSMALVQ